MWAAIDIYAPKFIKNPIYLHHLKARLEYICKEDKCKYLHWTSDKNETIPEILLSTPYNSDYKNIGEPKIYLDYSDQNTTNSKIIIKFKPDILFIYNMPIYTSIKPSLKKIHLNRLTISYNDKKFTYNIPNNENYEIIAKNYNYSAYEEYDDSIGISNNSEITLSIFIIDNNKKIEFFNFCTELLSALKDDKNLNISCTLEPYTNLELLKDKVIDYEIEIGVVRHEAYYKDLNELELLKKKIKEIEDEIEGYLKRIQEYKSEDIQKIIKSQNLKDFFAILQSVCLYDIRRPYRLNYNSEYEYMLSGFWEFIQNKDLIFDRLRLKNIYDLFWDFPIIWKFRNNLLNFAKFNPNAEKWILEHSKFDLRKYLDNDELRRLKRNQSFRKEMEPICIGKAISEYYNLPAFKNFLEDCYKLRSPFFRISQERFNEIEKNEELFSLNDSYSKYVKYYEKVYWEQYPYETEGITPHNVYEDMRNEICLLEKKRKEIDKIISEKGKFLSSLYYI